MMQDRVLHYRQTFSKLSETFIYDYLMELEHQGIDNYVLTLDRVHSDSRPFDGVTEVAWPGKWHPIRLARGISARLGFDGTVQESYRKEAQRRITAVTRRISPDVIHAHFGREGVFIAPIAERLQIPLVVTFYGFDISSLPKRDGWAEAYRKLWTQVDTVTVLSKEMRQKARDLGCPDAKLTVVHLSRDLDQFSYRSPGSGVQRVLFVGRLTPKKAPLDAVKALEQANERGANLHLEIVGDGECRAKVEEYIETNGLSEAVTLRGYLSNKEVSTLMNNADAFILPSVTAPDGDREGTPTVLVEAQATGLPCVTTHHAGIPEMIPPGNHHLLAEEGDVEKLADALFRLSKTPPEELEAIAQRGREKVEQDFSLSREVQKLCSIYQKLQASNKPRQTDG